MRLQERPTKPTARNEWPNPGFGVGLRPEHYDEVIDRRPAVDWLELLTEHFLTPFTRRLDLLDRIVDRYPVALHGTAMSLGSTDPLSRDYLARLKALVKRVRPVTVSDHLCWTGVGGRRTYDLLPLPFTESALGHMVARVRQAQDILGFRIQIENLSTYVTYTSSSMPEWEFLARIATEADCGILLDINNVYVSGYNHRFDPYEYIAAIPPNRVGQYHVARPSFAGTHYIDTHSGRVLKPVWDLYRFATEKIGPRATLLEWDSNVPNFDTLHGEVLKARAVAAEPWSGSRVAVRSRPASEPTPTSRRQLAPRSLDAVQRWFLDQIMEPRSRLSPFNATAAPAVLRGTSVAPTRGVEIYRRRYQRRLRSYFVDDYQAVAALLGADVFDRLIREFLRAHPPRTIFPPNLCERFARFLARRVAPRCRQLVREVCRAEQFVTQVAEAVETRVLDGERFWAQPAHRLSQSRLRSVAAFRLAMFNFPVSDVLSAARRRRPVGRVRRRRSHLVIFRSHADVIRLPLSPLGFRILRGLAAGQTVGRATKMNPAALAWLRERAAEGVFAHQSERT